MGAFEKARLDEEEKGNDELSGGWETRRGCERLEYDVTSTTG